MTQLLHLVKKDARRLRWWLAAWVALLAVRAIIAGLEARAISEGFNEEFVISQVTAMVALGSSVLLALLIARLVHEEPLVGYDWFWLTRPYNRRALVAAKLFIGGTCFVLLPLAFELLVMVSF